MHVAAGAAAGALAGSRGQRDRARPRPPRAPGRRFPTTTSRRAGSRRLSGLALLAVLALRRGLFDPATLGGAACAAPDLEHVLPLPRPGGRELYPSHRSRGVAPGRRLPGLGAAGRRRRDRRAPRRPTPARRFPDAPGRGDRVYHRVRRDRRGRVSTGGGRSSSIPHVGQCGHRPPTFRKGVRTVKRRSLACRRSDRSAPWPSSPRWPSRQREAPAPPAVEPPPRATPRAQAGRDRRKWRTRPPSRPKYGGRQYHVPRRRAVGKSHKRDRLLVASSRRTRASR